MNIHNKIIVFSTTILLIIYSCNNSINKPNNKQCDEFEYWEEVSDGFPYPGINCVDGSEKKIGLTIFVHKDYDNNDFISSEDPILQGVELLNSVYNPYGIKFNLDEIIYVDSPFPNPQEMQGSSEESTIEYGNPISISDLSEEVRHNYNFNNLNIILITDGWGAYSIYPWSNTTYYITMVRASTIQTSFILPHEIGHFLGLHHTHAYSIDGITTLINDPVSSPANWVDPINECFIMGDFICDTSYDCYNFCEEALGCDASYLYQDYHPGQEPSEYAKCGLDYSPPLDNLMSRYGDRRLLSNEQGARARYYLMYRLNNNLNGNILHLYN